MKTKPIAIMKNLYNKTYMLGVIDPSSQDYKQPILTPLLRGLFRGVQKQIRARTM